MKETGISLSLPVPNEKTILSNGANELKNLVAILQFRYGIQNKVYLRSFSTLFESKGVHVLLIIDRPFPHSQISLEDIEYHYVGGENKKAADGDNDTLGKPTKEVVLLRQPSSRFLRMLSSLKKDLLSIKDLIRIMRSSYKILASRHEELITLVGIEPFGGIVSAVLSVLLRRKFSYCSMELGNHSFFRNRLLTKGFNYIFHKAVRNAQVITAQDLDRASLLSEEFCISKDRVMLMPLGTTERKNIEKTDFVFQRLGIPRNKKIILYAGSIGECEGVKEISESVKNWPQEYCLVIHGYVDKNNNQYLNSILPLVDNNKIYISTDVVNWEDLDQLLCSAYISIAAYYMQDDNTRFISVSSNKLANYSRCGLPVIISHSENLRKMFGFVRWGETFSNYKDIASCILKIEADYDAYRKNCFKAFDEFYDFNRHGIKFIEKLLQ
jgi:hypothetical protein